MWVWANERERDELARERATVYRYNSYTLKHSNRNKYTYTDDSRHLVLRERKNNRLSVWWILLSSWVNRMNRLRKNNHLIIAAERKPPKKRERISFLSQNDNIMQQNYPLFEFWYIFKAYVYVFKRPHIKIDLTNRRRSFGGFTQSKRSDFMGVMRFVWEREIVG